MFKHQLLLPFSACSSGLSHVCGGPESRGFYLYSHCPPLFCYHPVICFNRGIRRFQLEDEPSQPVTLEGLSDSGSPVRLRFKQLNYKAAAANARPCMQPARPPSLSVSAVPRCFLHLRKKDCLKKKKKGIHTVMRFKTTDSPWACEKAGVCVTLIQA